MEVQSKCTLEIEDVCSRKHKLEIGEGYLEDVKCKVCTKEIENNHDYLYCRKRYCYYFIHQNCVHQHT